MSYEKFLSKIKDADIDVAPYLPFSLERIFIYLSPRNSHRAKTPSAPPFIAQYWTAGGVTGGSCWGTEHRPRLGEPAPDGFPELIKILSAVCPNLTFLQYEMVRQIIKIGTETEYEYYGNSTDYSYRVVILHELYNKLVEIGAINSEE